MKTRAFWQVWGPTPADETAKSLADVLEGPAGANPLSRSAVLRNMAMVEAWMGHFTDADRLVGTAKALTSEYGVEFDHVVCGTIAARIAMLRGDPIAAEREALPAIELYREIGDLGHLSSYAPELADAILAQGRDAEAMALTEEAERATIEGDTDAAVHWRRVRAKILARAGESDEALRLATEAADVARASDDLDKRGKTLLDLTEVLRLAGRTSDAIASAREALETFERKGNVVLAKTADDLLRDLSSG